jgi:hypothetical protein
MASHLLPWTHCRSLTGMDTWSVTYCIGHMACHLLHWTHCQSLTGMDTWSVTYWNGHMVGHLLRWTHCRSLTGMDTWSVTYCIGHMACHCTGHMACHLLHWTHCRSLSVLHTAVHLLRQIYGFSSSRLDTFPATHGRSLTALDTLRSLSGIYTWPVTYCAGHIAVT